MLSRRAFVGKLAAGAAIAGAATVGRAQALSARTESNTPTGAGNGATQHGLVPEGPASGTASPPASAPPPWELLQPLAEGSVVGPGWRVAGLSDVVDGSCVLTLRNAQGRAHRVHLCHNDGSPQGLVYTQRFDLVVMNGGQGDLPTDEGFAQAVAEVAHVLARNEADRRHAGVVAELLPHAKRVERFAAAAQLR